MLLSRIKADYLPMKVQNAESGKTIFPKHTFDFALIIQSATSHKQLPMARVNGAEISAHFTSLRSVRPHIDLHVSVTAFAGASFVILSDNKLCRFISKAHLLRNKFTAH